MAQVLWFAREAEGAIVGWFLGTTGELDQSIIMVDNEGGVRPFGRTAAEFLLHT